MSGRNRASLPEKLYKFRAFSAQSLDLLNRERIYYSDPATFNDPLDCKPSIKDDVPTTDLVRLCHLWNPGDDKDIPVGDGQSPGHRILDATGDAFYRGYLTEELSRLLQCELGKHGVLSLTARWNSPLMWSHYADQHHGICIEYDTTRLAHPNLQPVNYGAQRSIAATDLLSWKVNGCPKAKMHIRETYFLSKAVDWAYEHEWRDINDSHGEYAATLKVTAIYFGVRCPPIVRSIFMHVLPRETIFHEVFTKRDSFELSSRLLDRSEEIAMAQGSSAYLDFSEQITAAKL